VALGQVFPENFCFPCQSTFHLLLHNHLHYHPRLAQQARSGRSANSLTNQIKKTCLCYSFNISSAKMGTMTNCLRKNCVKYYKRNSCSECFTLNFFFVGYRDQANIQFHVRVAYSYKSPSGILVHFHCMKFPKYSIKCSTSHDICKCQEIKKSHTLFVNVFMYDYTKLKNVSCNASSIIVTNLKM
jgi:hypothetical protein